MSGMFETLMLQLARPVVKEATLPDEGSIFFTSFRALTCISTSTY